MYQHTFGQFNTTMSIHEMFLPDLENFLRNNTSVEDALKRLEDIVGSIGEGVHTLQPRLLNWAPGKLLSQPEIYIFLTEAIFQALDNTIEFYGSFQDSVPLRIDETEIDACYDVKKLKPKQNSSQKAIMQF